MAKKYILEDFFIAFAALSSRNSNKKSAFKFSKVLEFKTKTF